MTFKIAEDKIFAKTIGCWEMDNFELRQWNQETLAEISRHKWIDSERAGNDIGAKQVALDWLGKNKADWREIQNRSTIFV